MDFTDLIDLAGERVGGAALLANDEFFAPKENLLKPSAPEWREGVYTERGKWMDGWETRRRRTPGHDWCIVRLGIPGLVRGVVVDTSFFRGNYPDACSIDACAVDGTPDPTQLVEDTLGPAWVQIVPRSPLTGDVKNLFPVRHDARVTHVRLNIFPDGGVARLRVHGEGYLDRRTLDPGSEIDLAAAENGGFVLVCSDMFFGHRNNLIMPGRSTHMGDGWETKRRRGQGHDWTIVRLAARGALHRVEIDTDHFKGNAPGSAMVETIDAPGATADDLADPAREWRTLLPETPLQPHARHKFVEVAHWAPATHARLNIYPDGGIARLRLFGKLEGVTTDRATVSVDQLNALPANEVSPLLASCCGSSGWIARMLERRPFGTVSALLGAADEVWWSLEPKEWREAFACHPRIGEGQVPAEAGRPAVPQQSRATEWSALEQAAALEADPKVDRLLRLNNALYERRFGYIYVVCASGKTADELLAMLQLRLSNDQETELRVAAGEQAKITRLRLRRLLGLPEAS